MVSEIYESVTNARFIIWERTSRWAVAFRSVLLLDGLRVRESRDWRGCWDELQQAAVRLLALEIRRDNFTAAVDRLMLLRREHPQVGLLVLTTPEFQRYQWLFREAGAIEVIASTYNLAPAARLIRRFLSRAPQPTQGFHESLIARLPWIDS
jgi:hypothetical protein